MSLRAELCERGPGALPQPAGCGNLFLWAQGCTINWKRQCSPPPTIIYFLKRQESREIGANFSLGEGN